MKPEPLWTVLGTVASSPVVQETDPSRTAPRQAAASALLADRNGLYYPFLTAWIARGGRVPHGQEARWREEQRNRDRLQATLVTLNRASARSRVEYAVIKGASILDPVYRDVDVLVRDEEREPFLAALGEEGFVTVSEDEAEFSLAAPERLRVDLYSRIHYLGRDFLPVGELFTSLERMRSQGIEHPCLSPESSFLMNSIHGLLGHSAVSLMDFLDLVALRRQIGDLSRVRARAARAGWGVMFDRWLDHLGDLERRVYQEHRAVTFPARHGHRFILDCVDSLDGRPLSARELRVLGLTLLWDDLIYYTEDAGLDRPLKESRLASRLGNVVGHQLRILRGDSKSSRAVGGTDALGRGRTWLR